MNKPVFQKFCIMEAKINLQNRLTSIPLCLDLSMIFFLLWSASRLTKISSIPVKEERQNTMV